MLACMALSTIDLALASLLYILSSISALLCGQNPAMKHTATLDLFHGAARSVGPVQVSCIVTGPAHKCPEVAVQSYGSVSFKSSLSSKACTAA